MSNSSARLGPPRSARISPDRPSVGYSVIVLVVLIMVAGYVFSFFAIAAAAAWTGIPDNAMWIQFTAPIFIDGAIITYTTAFAVHRWRREEEHARYARRVLYFMTGVSVLINAAHAASFWQWEFGQYEALAGLLIAVMAPIASLFSAEQLIKLAFDQGGDVGEHTENLAGHDVSLDTLALEVEQPGRDPLHPADPLMNGALEEVVTLVPSATFAEGDALHERLVADSDSGAAATTAEGEAVMSVHPQEFVSEISADEWLVMAGLDQPSPEVSLQSERPGHDQDSDDVLPVDHNGFFVIPGKQAA